MYRFSGCELHDLFLKGEISATAIAQNCLKRIDHYDPQLGAFLSIFSERLIKKANELDLKRAEKKTLGKLAAIPIALKDNINLKGELTTCGSKFLSNYRSLFDATVTQLIEQEDGLIIGKTNMDEFAMGSSTENSAFHPTKNPWNLKCTPGGSSGGSAAAVSARFCPIALGSDTGGSIRQPAAFSGIAGFKPTYGRISRFGLVAFGSSLDQIGPLTTSVKDTALMMEVMGKHCRHDATSLNLPPEPFLQNLLPSIQGITVGIPWSFLEQLGTNVKENFNASLEVLKGLGCHFIDVDLNLLKISIAVYYILATAEASTNLARFDGVRYGKRSSKATTLEEVYDFSRQEGFGPEVKRRIMLGTYVLSSGYQEAYYKKAQKVRTLIIEKFKKAFEKCQVILTPTAPSPAFELGKIQDPLQMYLQDIYTVPANMAGLPALSVLSGFSSDQRPFGLHFTGPQLHDAIVLRFAHHFEQALGLYKEIPPLFDKEIK